MTTRFWPYMHTEARVYVKGDNVFISRGWSNARHQWKEQKRFYHHVTASSLRRLQKLYAVRRYNYGAGHYELYRTAYLRRAA